MSAPAVLFVTRKYPPARGGMEEFSHQLFEAYPGPKRLMAMTRSQAWLPAFCAQALAGARSSRRQFDALHLGDGMLAPFAAVLERSAQSPAFVTIHGQEVTRDVPGYRQALRAGLTRLGERVIAVSAFTAGASRTPR